MIAIDTDVLAIYYLFPHDARREVTEQFMRASEQLPRGVSIFNLLELCGLVASGGQPAEADRLFDEYQAADVSILYPPVTLTSEPAFWSNQNAELMTRIRRGLRLGDAVVLWAVESNHCAVLVTWNVRHFQQHTDITVQTPME